jgi:uncharacterized protein (DUF58 family)
MEPQADLTRVGVPGLVLLSRAGATLPLGGGRILARQGGDYLSPFRGRGMEFSESRPYQPGDDVRNIDWRVTARTGRAHTKLFREERERPVFLCVDFRASMFFATRGRFKAVAAAQMAALAGWAAALQGDRIGGMIFADTEHHELKPQRGRGAVLRFIRALVSHPAWYADRRGAPAADAGHKALARLRHVVRPGSLVFLFSDFRWLDEPAQLALGRLARHSDVVPVFISDPVERALPPPGLYRVSDGAAEIVIDTGAPSLTAAYARRFAERDGALAQLARRHDLRVIRYGTEQDPVAALRDGLRREVSTR